MNEEKNTKRASHHDFGAIAAEHQQLVVPQVVHGNDDRQIVADTTRYPASAVAQLTVTASDGEIGFATGCFIRPHVLLTAAHAIHVPSGPAAGRVREMLVIPGRDGDNRPFGDTTTSNFYVPDGWVQTQLPQFDYGLVFVTPFANVGVFHPVVVSDAKMANLSVLISGYPRDRDPDRQLFARSVVQSFTSTEVSYDIDTEEGDSGTHVFHFENDAAFTVAIHRFGNTVLNFGTRITQAIINDIMMRV
jgi:glutamyl endopeptidase